MAVVNAPKGKASNISATSRGVSPNDRDRRYPQPALKKNQKT
jgi:hypothetical protein